MKYPVPANTRSYQQRASDPAVSAWVSAHAGSGKTHVLTQRVVRLMLAGVPASRLICLTFTKAAAANMSARVFRTLADWTLADDETLRAKIIETGARPPPKLDTARKLFAEAVETPGGLKIQTIHAFCERVLHLFPFEANAPAEFRAAEDLERAELLALAQRQTFAAADDDPILGAALALVSEESSEDGFSGVLNAALGKRAALDDVDGMIARLPAALGLAPDDSESSIQRAMVEDGIHWSKWAGLAEIFAGGSTTDQEQAARLRAAAALAPDPACLGDYLCVFFTSNGAGSARKKFGTKAVEARAPALAEDMAREAARLDGLRGKLRAVAVRDRSVALLRLAAACQRRYDALKRARGVLDFEDMIEKTRALFTREGAAAWALYKLDNGVDHILVDEAQDTSAAQWEILEALASEFMAGAGARGVVRTFFAVGDEKQSIFSFQGASARSFDEKRRQFAAGIAGAGQPFDLVPLDRSFRSSKDILDAVDHIFARDDARKGLHADPAEPPPKHSALKHDMPGMVDIWEPVQATEPDDPRDWKLPVDLPGETSPPVELARRIARKIKSLMAADAPDRIHDADGALRPVRPGDVMILVRRRDAFFEAMVRALKTEGVPVAGADRLDIAGHIAVMDLLAAARASLAPDDDYSLACALKSPLCGLDDDDLIQLAPKRPGSLETALRASADPRHAAAAEQLDRWRARAGTGRPFDFFSGLLSPDGGRRAFLARLGAEAGDALDEFMSLALEHERTQAPSLAAFVHEIEALELTVKRDMEGADDLVRVMTAHAAKGLEGKIVFLPDTCRTPPANEKPLFELQTPAGPALVWSPRKAEDPPAVAVCRQQARDEVENEYRRLLYVALTRAEERLYICGHHGVKGAQGGCWLELIREGLSPHLREVPDEFAPGGVARRFGNPALGAERMAEKAPEPIAAPAWLFAAAPQERDPAPPLRPSSALSGADRYEARDAAEGARRSSSIQRGILAHQLMQSLPLLPVEQRSQAGLRYLRAQAPAMDADAARALAEEAASAIALADAAPLFSATSRAEVAIAAHIARAGKTPVDIAGRIDRLAEVGDDVWIADFKTGAAPADTPQAYIAQLALYRAALQDLYQGRNVRAFLFWTETPRLQEIPADAMDAALDAI